MFQGLFPTSELNRRHVLSLIPQCGACKLHESCKSPKMKVDGRGKSRVLIVGESPGRQEDEQGRPFIGSSGEYLKNALRKFGMDLREDCWITNALICKPKEGKVSSPHWVNYCRPNLVRTVQELNPELIIPLGKLAVSSLIGWVWKEDPGPISRWVGWQIPCQSLNAWIAPNYHPAHVLRADEKKGERHLLDKFFYRYIQQALELPRRPWRRVPDYDRVVRRVHSPQEAADVIPSFEGSRPVAFDFETDRLKPDHPDSRILCCALSDGDRAVAFPWAGPVVPAMKQFLTSDTPKVGANVKFEDRWCRRVLGVGVRNWAWDTVVNAHLIDHRKQITSVKFQSFVLLGAGSYDDQLKAHMNSENNNSPNSLRGVSLDKLLLYCGKDALFESLIAEAQAERLGIPLC